MPLVSVIIATYNRERYIKRAVESALNQSHQDMEIIVVDDGSTDNTQKAIGYYIKENKIKYFYQENKDATIARDNGIKASKGKYIAILDSDDYWQDPDKIKKQVEFLEKNKDYVLIGGGIIIVNERGKEMARFLHPQTDNEIRKRMLFSPQFAHSSVIFPKKAYNLIGGYDKNLSQGEDWDLWLKLGKVGKTYNFQEFFLVYLKSINQKTSNWRNEIKNDNFIRKRHRNDYPGYYRSLLFSFVANIYYRIPFVRRFFYPLSPLFRKLIFNVLSFRLKIFSKNENNQ